MHTSLIEVQNLKFGYTDGNTLFNNVSMSIPRGTIATVRGPSGAGKSTLLRLLCRLEEVNKGDILLEGDNIKDISPELLRRKMAYIQQTPTVVEGTVKENLLLPYTFAVNANLAKPEDRDMRKALDHVLLRDVQFDDSATSLSVGQKQRLCIVRSMLLKPAVLLLDEPTSALDARSADIVIAMVEDLNRLEKLTALMITHGDQSPKGQRNMTITVENGEVKQS